MCNKLLLRLDKYDFIVYIQDKGRIMKIKDKFETDIAAVGMNGEGIARIDNTVVFVPSVLKGERAWVEITDVKKNFAFAKVIKLLEASSDRVNPPCRICYKCGGCEMLHIAYPAQLEIKRANVKNCLDKELKSDVEVNETVPSPDVYGYRNKIQLPIAIVDGKICAGFFAPNTHKVIPFIREGEDGKCLLNDEGMQKIISTFLTFVKENNISVYDERLHKGLIRHLVIRRVGESYAVCAVINGKSLPSYKSFVAKLKSSGYCFSLYISVNEKRTNVIMGEKTVTLYGEDKVRGNALGVTYEVSPLSFMQVNDKVRDLIYSKVGEIIKNSGIDNVIDAYSGIGIMSNIFARYAKKVYAIEIVPEAIEDAKKLAALNGNSDKIVNICGDCAKELPPLITSLGKSVVVIDPPRKGCDKAVLEAMLTARPTEIIYVSCNPATLARDLRILSEGYSIESVTPYDMFPNTKHVETLAVLVCRH